MTGTRTSSSAQRPQSSPRVILVDPNDEAREVLERRLGAQGYQVEATSDPAIGAEMALASPPAVLIAELWMPSISGVQLCRLLGTEPATADVPVILRGKSDDPRSRFWAERAGAVAYVPNGRMAELVRALDKTVSEVKRSDDFFMQLSGSVDIRDRIARHLDDALFESVIASEVRALASQGSFERLFDAFSQFLSQVIEYRWLAIRTTEPEQVALHHHPHAAEDSQRDACTALSLPPETKVMRIADEDAREALSFEGPIVCPIPFGGTVIGQIALAPATAAGTDNAALVELVAREIGGPLRIAALMEESQRLATEDSLTGLLNRRAFLTRMDVEVARSQRYNLPLSLLLIDIDLFKSINDTYGHAAGDQALSEVGAVLKREMRVCDLVARWGGEELVIALTNTDAQGGAIVAERLRRAIEAIAIPHGATSLRLTASIGVATLHPPERVSDLIERADRAMYAAKKGGRNRVAVDPLSAPSPTEGVEQLLSQTVAH